MAFTSGYQQAGTLISRASVQLTLGPVTDAMGSTDPNVAILREHLNTIGDWLNSKQTWTAEIKEYTFTTIAGTTAYDLPSDFHQMVPESGWNRSMRLPLLGPLTSQEVQTIKAQLTGVVLNVPWRKIGNQFVFPISPPNGHVIAFEYISSNWVSTDGVTSNADTVTSNADWVLYDPLLIVRALKLQWTQQKGFDSAVYEREFREALDHAYVKATGARTLRLDGEKIIDKYLNKPQTPPSGFGM